MAKSNLQPAFDNIMKALDERRIGRAIAELKAFAMAASASWTLGRRIDSIGESYGYLCRYAIDGVDDPQREAVYDEIMSDIRQVAASILRSTFIPDSPKQYFSVLRYEELQQDSSISKLIEEYTRLNRKLGLAAFGNNNQELKTEGGEPLGKAMERLSDRLFNMIWTTYPLSASDEESIEAAFNSEALAEYFKASLLSAVYLGGMEYFDERRLLLLGRLYMSRQEKLEVKALAAMVLLLWYHRDKKPGRRFRMLFESMSENPAWAEDLKMVFLELVRTRDTERITHTLKDDVIPEMMKMRKDITRSFTKGFDVEDLESMSDNPEWEELFEKSGLGDKLRELNELQTEGADVMMGTFAGLKSFPFFSDVPHWFLPFYLEYSAVRGVMDDSASDLGELIYSNPMMCDSDKYSIIFSLDRIPSAQRRMMLQQFKLGNVNLAELRNSELNPELSSRRNVLNKYVQDLYRFYKLYRRNQEFPNPFSSPINLASVGLLSPFIKDTDALAVIAEFYFKRKYYSEAIELFEILLSVAAPTSELYQKTGYCLQNLGRVKEAVDMYERSELLNPGNLWTMRRLAQTYRQSGDIEKALEYYQAVSEAKPEDLSVALNLGHCCLQLDRYEDALKHYFKYEFNRPDSLKALRPIAWCLFLSGDYGKSRGYYDRIVALGAEAMDYMNLGHLYLADGKYRDALDSYRVALERYGDTEAFLNTFGHDRHILESKGVDALLIDIVVDNTVNPTPN